MNKKLISLFSAVSSMVLPLAASAQQYSAPFPSTRTTLSGQDIMEAVLKFMWPIFIGYAIIMFIVAGYKFIAGKADEGRNALIYGAIGVIVGVVAWSLPAIVTQWV